MNVHLATVSMVRVILPLLVVLMSTTVVLMNGALL